MTSNQGFNKQKYVKAKTTYSDEDVSPKNSDISQIPEDAFNTNNRVN